MKKSILLALSAAVVFASSCQRKQVAYFQKSQQENFSVAQKVAIPQEAKPTLADVVIVAEPKTQESVVLASSDESNIALVQTEELKARVTEQANLVVKAEKVQKVTFSQKVKAIKQVAKAQKEAKKSTTAVAGGKSQVVALVLSLLLGGLGIHRFYLGYTGIGIIQLLTLGGFGIWALIDIIRIAMGTLKPKGGDYDVKF